LKVFYGFLIVFTVVILFMLPITEAVYDFRTDLREDTFNVETPGVATTGNVTLHKAVYDNDTSTIAITSDISTDTPILAEYHTTTRLTDITGLTASTNRTLTISYDVDALNASTALDIFIERIALIWLLVVIAFAPAAIVSMWITKRS
jgi:hypothetical protein